MLNTVLVTYASRTGSTAGVAKVIGKTLAEAGAEVDVRPMSEIKDLTPYQVVIAGSAIQDGKWLPEAMQFVETHRFALRQKYFAAFLVCMTLAISNEQWREQAHVEDWLKPVREMVEPISEGYFAGMLDISKVPSLRKRLMFRLSTASGIWTEGDHRDWEAIRGWAAELSRILQLPSVAVRVP